MDEKKLKRQLVIMAAIIASSSLILCAILFAVLTYIMETAREADYAQMQTETQEYKSRIFKQMDKNLQILTTLSKAYEASRVTESMEELEQSVAETSEASSFVSLAYIPSQGEGVLNTPGHGTRHHFSLDDCSDYARQAVERALQGENAVSKLFDSEASGAKVFVYSVPVYAENEIIGALAASDTLEIFRDIVNGNTVMGGRGYVHILDSEGNFLVRSENTLVKEKMNSIFDGPYLSESTKVVAKEAFANQESMFGDFEYQGEKCHFYVEPIDLNGWYLFCVDRRWGATLPFRHVLLLVVGSFAFILILVLFLLYYGYYKFRKNAALLLKMAYVDSVTGAKNTARFDRDFEQALKAHQNYSVAALNVRNFKGINDLFGMSGGDKVLCYIKQVIETHLAEEEFFCRDAADTFYILLLECDEQKLRIRFEQIIRAVSETTSHAQYSYELFLYAGIAIQGTREKALVALQSIRHTHRSDIALYNTELHERIRKKNRIENEMHAALQNKEFKLFLQPKNSLKDDSLIGAEALVRWQKPDGSCRYPDEFIPLFEANGFCIQLDLYMIERACEQIQAWINAGIEPIPISVNQSKLLFSDRNYPEHIKKIVDQYHIPSHLIILEILEDIATGDLEQINSQIELLHAKGFKVSMDDFGSGYSSLNMLYRLKIDELKLDKGFLLQSAKADDKRRQIILEQIIRLAQRLGICTVAEGVETQRDKETMAALSCDYGQGYFFQRPISAAQFNEKYMNVLNKPAPK